MIEVSPKVNLCLHVIPEFKNDEHVVCRLDTDQGPLDMATCKPCLDRILNGDTAIYEKYVSVTRERAALLGVRIQG